MSILYQIRFFGIEMISIEFLFVGIKYTKIACSINGFVPNAVGIFLYFMRVRRW